MSSDDNNIRNDDNHSANEMVDCPACGLPAEITDRFTLGGAPGPVEHVKIVCVMRHWFTLPVDLLPAGVDGPERGSMGSEREADHLRNIP